MEPTDISMMIGPLPWPNKPEPEYTMASYERAAITFWQGIFDGLVESGWTEEEAFFWLQSKGPRWALDGKMGDKLSAFAKRYAKTEINKEGGDYSWVKREMKRPA